MSNHLISEVYKRQIGNIAKNALMVMLADKASDDGSGIWASKQRMADELGASRQTVITTMNALIEDGLVRECGQRKCQNAYTVEYAINVPALRSLPLVKCHEDDPSKDLTRQAALPVKDLDVTRQAALHDPSKDLTQTLLNLPEPPNTQKPRARKIEDDWQPKPFGPNAKSTKIIATWTQDERETIIEHFIAHHQAKKTKADDWQPWWQTWVINSTRFGVTRNGHQNIRSGNGNGAGKGSSLSRAIDAGLDHLGGT